MQDGCVGGCVISILNNIKYLDSYHIVIWIFRMQSTRFWIKFPLIHTLNITISSFYAKHPTPLRMFGMFKRSSHFRSLLLFMAVKRSNKQHYFQCDNIISTCGRIKPDNKEIHSLTVFYEHANVGILLCTLFRA